MGIYLPKANKTKDTTSGECSQLSYAASCMQGWRTSMEDAHISECNIVDNVHLFAVFDGHGGPEVARFCSKYFVQNLKNNPNFVSGNYDQALRENFLKMDELLQEPSTFDILRQFKKEGDSSSQSYAGCTANVCIITQNEIYCANAGDSRSIVFTGNTYEKLSEDHKPDLEVEHKRIKAAGGYVSDGRVNDNLNLTRAIGDLEYKKNTALKPEQQIITAFPDVKKFSLAGKPKFVLMGCDGIWEMKTEQQLCDFLKSKIDSADTKLTSAVEDLLEEIVAKDTSEGIGCDNMSCILIVFK